MAKSTRKLPKTKSRQLPKTYKPGYLENLDARSSFALRLRALHGEIIEDLGGDSDVSATKRVLIERFVFLTAKVQEWETEIFRGDGPADKATLDKWIYSVNSLQGLAVKIGLKKELVTITVNDYLDAQE